MNYEQLSSDFALRTKTLIEEYQGDYEVTLLVNCCLGLLVVPKERDFQKIPDDMIPVSGELWGLSRTSINVACQECGYSLRDVIRKIRNGICHFKIKTIPDENNQIDFLEIKDSGEFLATLSVEQLRILAFSLTDHVYSPDKQTKAFNL